jgi:hypothetical protein
MYMGIFEVTSLSSSSTSEPRKLLERILSSIRVVATDECGNRSCVGKIQLAFSAESHQIRPFPALILLPLYKITLSEAFKLRRQSPFTLMSGVSQAESGPAKPAANR